MDKPETCEQQLLSFLLSDERNRGLEDKTMQVYVRKSKRLLPHGYTETLDIANTSVRNRGKGRFTAFLTYVETTSPRVVFIENVLEGRFLKFFMLRGYHLVEGSNPPCCYKGGELT